MSGNGMLKKRRVVAALLSTKSVSEAAGVAEVSERTIRRWMADDSDFRQGLADAENDLIDQATRRLISLQEQALDAFSAAFERLTEQAGLNVADLFSEEQYIDPVTRQPAKRLSLDIEKIKANGRLIKKIKVKDDELEVEAYDAQKAVGMKLQAAQAILSSLVRLRELRNTEERLANLEKAVYEQKGQT